MAVVMPLDEKDLRVQARPFGRLEEGDLPTPESCPLGLCVCEAPRFTYDGGRQHMRRLPLFFAERSDARIALGQRKTTAEVRDVVDRALELAQTMIEQTKAVAPPEQPIACDRGCAWCCHSKVIVTEAEVIRIAEYLRAELT